MVLLLETVVRRLEEVLKNQTGGVLPLVASNWNRSYFDNSSG